MTHVAALDPVITAPKTNHQRLVGKDGHEARNPSAPFAQRVQGAGREDVLLLTAGNGESVGDIAFELGAIQRLQLVAEREPLLDLA